MAAGGGRVGLLQGCRLCKATHALVVSSISTHKRKKERGRGSMKLGEKRSGEIVEELEGRE